MVNEKANLYNERVILNIYKEKNWTSFDVVAKVRNLLKVKRVGHAGTLDPLAEGVLVVLTDFDTKKQDDFLKMSKEYITEIAFGAESPTYDLEMVPVFVGKQVNAKELKDLIDKILPKYIGEFEQTAPPYSAKKVGGKVLYKEARKGNTDFVLPKKLVTASEIETLDIFEKEIETDKGAKVLPVLKCRIKCSSGFYVRSLAHDLGVDTNLGGVMISLVRTKIGDFDIKDSKKVAEICS